MTQARENVDKLRLIKTINDYNNITDALEAVQAAGGKLYFPVGTHSISDVSTNQDVLIYGDGLGTILDGSFEITSGTGTVVLSAKDLLFSGDTSSSLKVTQAGTQDMILDIEGITVEGADAAVTVRNSGEILGHIVKVRASDLTQYGINVGWNDYTAQQGWGPMFIAFNHVSDVDGGAGSSAYGILSYAKHNVIMGNFIDGVTSTSGTGTEGIYTKGAYSVIVGNILKDAGEGEAFLNIKGNGLGSTAAPNGYNVIAVGTNAHATDTYISAAAQVISGVNIACDNIMVNSTIVDNMTEAGLVYTANGDIQNAMVSGLLVYDGTLSKAGVWFGGKGGPHTLRDFVINNITGTGILINGMQDAAKIYISDGIIDTISDSGIRFNPVNAVGLVDCQINNLVFKDVSGAAALFFDNVMMNRVELIDIDCGLRTADFLDREAAAGANAWYVRNLHGRVQTTSASTTDIASFNVPQGKILLITVRYTAAKTDGTKLYCLERKAAYSNAAGTAAIIGTGTDVFTQSSGSPTYAGTIVASGAGVVVRVAGATNETVDWHISIDVDTI